jgi:pSer/pThr/pTyr-binding forkhead associated (FHA) protein
MFLEQPSINVMPPMNRFVNSLDSFNAIDDPELNKRLGLYQLFLRLYDQHRSLLDEILDLENVGNRPLASLTPSYIQGLVLEQQVYLVTNLLKGLTQTLTQPQNIWTIGRDPRRAIFPIQDRRLSRLHAAIQFTTNQEFKLVDLGSSNGSFVNGEMIKQATTLKDGDRVCLGSLSFTFFICRATKTLSPVSTELIAQLEQFTPPQIDFNETLELPFIQPNSASPSSDLNGNGKSLGDTALVIKK